MKSPMNQLKTSLESIAWRMEHSKTREPGMQDSIQELGQSANNSEKNFKVYEQNIEEFRGYSEKT